VFVRVKRESVLRDFELEISKPLMPSCCLLRYFSCTASFAITNTGDPRTLPDRQALRLHPLAAYVITMGDVNMDLKRASQNVFKRESRPVDDTISAVPGEWRFDKNVSQAFDSHVHKSVPFYDEIQRMVIELSEYFVRDHSVVYDLGSSTGTTLDLLSSVHAGKEDVQFIGFDLSKFMIKEARKKVNRPNVRFHHKNIMDVEFSPPANFLTSLFTIQFLTLAERRTLLTRINEGLTEGGGVLIVEKVSAEHSCFEDIWAELYWDFKRRQGLTPEQILEKANSIRGVLKPLTADENIDLLWQTGYSQVEVFFKWYNWAGFLAVKNQCVTSSQAPRQEAKSGSKKAQSRQNSYSARLTNE
jgi:tRNA (cmo5U34)-methyltransferase